MTDQLDAQRSFQEETQQICEHIETGTITRAIFESFWSKVDSQLAEYKREIEKYKHEIASSSKKKPSNVVPPKSPEIDVEQLLSTHDKVIAFEQIQSRSPKCKAYIEFYPSFLTIISQQKCTETALKTVVHYTDIERIICVPEKNKDVLLYIKLAYKFAIKWRGKQSIDAICVSFNEHDDAKEDRELNNSNTTLPSTLSGTVEDNFRRVIKELSKIEVDYHDEKLFSTKDAFSQHCGTLPYIEPVFKTDKCLLYPLQCGIFIAPKPLRFEPISRIKHYEYKRTGQQLRYFDLTIVLYSQQELNEDISDVPQQKDENHNSNNSNSSQTQQKKKKKRPKELEIPLSMIPKEAKNEIERYFSSMDIRCKEDGKPSPDRRRKDNKEQKEANPMDDTDDDPSVDANDDHDAAMCDLSESDDEEYDVDDDKDDEEYDDDDDSDSEYDDEYDPRYMPNEASLEKDEVDDEETDDDDMDVAMHALYLRDAKSTTNGVGKAKKKETKTSEKDKNQEVLVKTTRSRKPTVTRKMVNNGKNRKRTRAEMEAVVLDDEETEDEDHTVSTSSSSLQREPKRRKFGRKTPAFDERAGAKIVSKTVPKKQKTASNSDSNTSSLSPKKSPVKAKKMAKKRKKSKSQSPSSVKSNSSDIVVIGFKSPSKKKKKTKVTPKKKRKLHSSTPTESATNSATSSPLRKSPKIKKKKKKKEKVKKGNNTDTGSTNDSEKENSPKKTKVRSKVVPKKNKLKGKGSPQKSASKKRKRKKKESISLLDSCSDDDEAGQQKITALFKSANKTSS